MSITRIVIKNLSNGIYKNVDDIKTDNTLTLQIWTNESTRVQLNDNKQDILNSPNPLNLKIQVSETNKVFNSMAETTLSIDVSKLDLVTNNLSSSLAFTKNMTPQVAYMQLCTKIKDLL